MGQIHVPHDRYWGAQTARSLIHFDIGDDVMPPELIRGVWILKKACALVNRDLGKLPEDKAKLIAPGGRRSHRRQAGRPFPSSHLADRQRHADQHERQRGHLQPRDRDRRRRDGVKEADPSE